MIESSLIGDSPILLSTSLDQIRPLSPVASAPGGSGADTVSSAEMATMIGRALMSSSRSLTHDVTSSKRHRSHGMQRAASQTGAADTLTVDDPASPTVDEILSAGILRIDGVLGAPRDGVGFFCGGQQQQEQSPLQGVAYKMPEDPADDQRQRQDGERMNQQVRALHGAGPRGEST